MGLLSKASNLDFSDKLAFSDFIKKNNIKTCAVLECNENIFFINNSIGFDAFSISASESTYDFWDGVCSRKNIVFLFNKENENLKSLLQFFSYTMQESISFISIYRTNDQILLLVNQEINNNIISDFIKIDFSLNSRFILDQQSLDENKKIFKFEVNLLNAINSYDEKTQVSLLNEISNRFISKYFVDTSSRINLYKIRFFVISYDQFDGNIISQHIKLNLQEVIGNNSNKISISFVGTSNDLNELELFMKVE